VLRAIGVDGRRQVEVLDHRPQDLSLLADRFAQCQLQVGTQNRQDNPGDAPAGPDVQNFLALLQQAAQLQRIQ
jgi:hypothetical protein